jgi:hypothetical protein
MKNQTRPSRTRKKRAHDARGALRLSTSASRLNSKFENLPFAPATISASAELQNTDATLPRKTIESVIRSAQQRNLAAKQTKSNYQTESQRPIACLLFVFPLILAYELGTIFLGGEALRSGVDQWLDRLLNLIGFGQLVLLPVITTAILVILHHRQHDHWQITPLVLSGMILETIGLGLMLFWAANVIHLISQTAVAAGVTTAPIRLAPEIWWSNTIAVMGSGIYEELFFRLMLLAPAIDWATKITDRNFGKIIGIFGVSLLFAALHYDLINPAGSAFEMSSFFFRFSASIIFSVLFLFRGFGVAVGTHVAFDVLTQI